MIRPRWRPPALALLVALPVSATADEMVLQFERSVVTVTRSGPGPGGARLDTTNASILLCLGDRRLVVREPEQECVYDFAGRRVRVIDTQTMTFADWSLFGLVAINELELANRLQTRGKGAPRPSVRELEALFSMPALHAKLRPGESLTDSSRDDRVEVRINGHPFTSAYPSATELPGPWAQAFERFLLYHCRLHPRARQAIMRTGKVPGLLLFRYLDGNEETIVTLRLSKATTTPEVNDPVRGLAQLDIKHGAYRALAKRLKSCREQSADSVRDRRRLRSIEFENESMARGQFLEASLARLARSLEGCERLDVTGWPDPLRRAVLADTGFRACLEAADTMSAARASRVLQRLARFQDSNLQMHSVIELLAGRAMLARGDVENGTRQVVRGLQDNPCAIRVWMDLGQAFLRGRQPILGWLCFDAARAAAPAGCAEVTAIANLERDLLARHPEFLE